MKTRTFAVGIAILVVLASFMVYYATSAHPENIGISNVPDITGYAPDNFTISTHGSTASYIMFRDSNTTKINVNAYGESFANLSTFMILYLYKKGQNLSNPYTSLSFQINGASMYIAGNNSTRENIPVSMGKVGQYQQISNYDFYRTLTIVKSQKFLTMILRPSPLYFYAWEKQDVRFTLKLNITKVAGIGLMPFDEGNQQIVYSVNLKLL